MVEQHFVYEVEVSKKIQVLGIFSVFVFSLHSSSNVAQQYVPLSLLRQRSLLNLLFVLLIL